MSPLELIQDAEALAEMSTAEQLYAGAQVAVLGMVIVFSILLILLITIKIIEKFAGSKAAAEKMSSAVDEKKPGLQEKAAESSGHKKPEKKGEIKPEVMAAITASIQAFYGQRSEKFRIIRVQKKSRPVSAWMRKIESDTEARETRSENREVT